jgi:hypothetical protein
LAAAVRRRSADRRARALERGFALADLLFAATLLSVVSIGAYTLLDEEMASATQGMRLGRLETRATDEAELVAQSVQMSDSAFFGAGVLGGTTQASVVVRRPTGVQNGSIVWGPPTTIRWRLETGETSNGVDDDGDRLVDEGVFEWIENLGTANESLVRSVSGLASYGYGEQVGGGDEDGNGLVDERGFGCRWDGSRLRIALTLQRADGRGRTIQAEVETAVRPRNAS